MTDRLPEHKAAQRLAATIGVHLQPQWLTNACLEDVMRKCVAHRVFFRGVFDELDADPTRVGDRGTVLRQQEHSRYDSQDDLLERLAYLKAEWDLLRGYLTRMDSPYAATLRDLDEMGATEDDERISRERADEKAAANAPELGAAS